MRKLTVLLLAFVIVLPQIPADAQARRSSSNSSTSTSASSSTTQTPKRQSTKSSSSSEQTPRRQSSTSSSQQKSTSTSSDTPKKSSTTTATSSSQTPKRQSSATPSSTELNSSSQTPKRQSVTSDQKSQTTSQSQHATARRNTSSSQTQARQSQTSSQTSQSQTQPLASARRGVKTIERPSSTPQAPVILGDNKPENPKPSTKLTATEMTYRHSPQYQQDHGAKLPPPRERACISYKRPANHFHPYEHFYGYRIKRLPCGARHVFYCGMEFYYHRGIYFRLYDRHYVVCRPPFETVISVSMMRDMRFAPVHFFYYDVLDRPYEIANANYRYIQEQNAIIARNNAIIARQNVLINQFDIYKTRSEAAYQSARFLGLSQSYAFADAEYFYEDGVFYILDRDCYRVIVPPAGAIVDSIPEDYEIITLADGNTYYKVDDTVYSLTILDGNACFEVLGQLFR